MGTEAVVVGREPLCPPSRFVARKASSRLATFHLVAVSCGVLVSACGLEMAPMAAWMLSAPWPQAVSCGHCRKKLRRPPQRYAVIEAQADEVSA